MSVNWQLQFLLRKTGSISKRILLQGLYRNLLLRVYRPPICHNVKLWLKSYSSNSSKSISASRIIYKQPPKTLESEIYHQFLNELKYEVPEKYLARIENAQLVGRDGLLVLPEGSYAVEVAWNQGHLEALPDYYNEFRLRQLRRNIKKKQGSYYSLLSLWCGKNYYHWIHDALQRLYLVTDLLPEATHFIVPSSLTRYQYDSLKFAGIKDDQIICLGEQEVWELEALYFSPPTTVTGCDSPNANRWLQGLSVSNSGLDEVKQTKRIYISRRLATCRRIVNEFEIEQHLKGYGFDTYLLEEMSFSDQVSLFNQAEIVISSHGSGLTNLMFAHPKTMVLEVFEPEIVRTCFWSLSESLGQDYWYILGESRHNFPEPDIYLAPRKLLQTLEQMLQAKTID